MSTGYLIPAIQAHRLSGSRRWSLGRYGRMGAFGDATQQAANLASTIAQQIGTLQGDLQAAYAIQHGGPLQPALAAVTNDAQALNNTLLLIGDPTLNTQAGGIIAGAADFVSNMQSFGMANSSATQIAEKGNAQKSMTTLGGNFTAIAQQVQALQGQYQQAQAAAQAAVAAQQALAAAIAAAQTQAQPFVTQAGQAAQSAQGASTTPSASTYITQAQNAAADALVQLNSLPNATSTQQVQQIMQQIRADATAATTAAASAAQEQSKAAAAAAQAAAQAQAQAAAAAAAAAAQPNNSAAQAAAAAAQAQAQVLTTQAQATQLTAGGLVQNLQAAASQGTGVVPIPQSSGDSTPYIIAGVGVVVVALGAFALLRRPRAPAVAGYRRRRRRSSRRRHYARAA